MKLIPRRKSRRSQAVEVITQAVKLGAAWQAAKGAGKGARKAAKGTAAYKAGKAAAQRTPGVRRLPVVLAAGGAGLVAVRKLRSRGTAQPASATPPPVTSATAPG
jgi:hypothetical protein